MSWTKRQRIEAVFNGEQPDRVPIYDLMVNDAAIEYYAGQKITKENDLETICKAVGNAFDMTRDVFAPRITPRDFTDDGGYVYHLERWTSWILKYPFSNDDELIRFMKEDTDSLEAWKPSLKDIKIFQDNCDHTQKLLNDTVNISVCPNANINYAFNKIGLQKYCYLMYDEPELLKRWLKSQMDFDLRRIDAFADYKNSPVVLIYCDIAQKGTLIFSRDYLKRFVYPHIRAIAELMHSKGIKVIFHSDGNIMGILEDLVDLGIDGINPLEINAGMDIKEIKEKFGRKLIICGGIDVTHLLPIGTKDEVIEGTKQLIRLAGKDYGLCLGSSTEMEDNVPLENVRAMIETVWEYGRYPLL